MPSFCHCHAIFVPSFAINTHFQKNIILRKPGGHQRLFSQNNSFGVQPLFNKAVPLSFLGVKTHSPEFNGTLMQPPSKSKLFINSSKNYKHSEIHSFSFTLQSNFLKEPSSGQIKSFIINILLFFQFREKTTNKGSNPPKTNYDMSSKYLTTASYIERKLLFEKKMFQI